MSGTDVIQRQYGVRTITSLRQLAVSKLCASWHANRYLGQLPLDLAKLVWAELKSQRAASGAQLSCSDMFPLVRDLWHAECLDFSDCGRWITNSSLQALGYIRSLRSVRLTACRFITDDGLVFLPSLPLHTIDVSWTPVSDVGMGAIAQCASLTSLNLTGLDRLTDRGVASLLKLTSLRRLALACTNITDAALDYLTYYSRYPDAATGSHGLSELAWLELSNTRVAVLEDGKPYGKVFKKLEYLALSMTSGVGPSAVRQVRTKYGFDTPLPNAQRTLAKSNAVALDARDWVIRFMPTKDRQLQPPARSWEQSRLVNYVAQYTKEMAAAAAELEQSGGALPAHDAEGHKRQRLAA